MAKYKNIYVLAPQNYCSGGPELSHQLVDYLRKKGINAYIVYTTGSNNMTIAKGAKVPEPYKKYNIEISTDIEDSKENILVLPEIWFEWLSVFNNINYGCWWMSVDNHYKQSPFIDKWCFFKTLKWRIRLLINIFKKDTNSPKITIKRIKEMGDRVVNFYQSAYAQNHLYKIGFSRVLPLSDYINSSFLVGETKTEERENMVLYNPKKGLKFTRKLIKTLPDIKFVALQNLSREELLQLMRRAKLYIDFGSFPGKDRLPRECVMNGCCLLTGKLGASYFYEDVPISSKYKYEVKSENISKIKDTIEYIMENYQECKSDFDFMRERIKREESVFYSEIESAFIE